MHVNLFIPCLVDQFHPRVGVHAERILKRIGATVSYNDRQVCCGQPFFNSGYREKALPLARNMISVFRGADAVVAPSASCVNMIRNHYRTLFREDRSRLEEAEDLAKRTYELTEFLIHVAGVEDLGARFTGKITFHDSCQMKRGLGLSSEPRRLLRQVRGLELVEMNDSDACCGFGGTFSLKHPHISGAMAEDKMRNILATGAEAVVGCEISCLMHIGRHLNMRKIPVRAMHIAEILDTE